ncbi:MAG: prepilin-type N-terminal cleavage/methylation domain-containing protein [Lachnospiraceae bacterium]|nr:prepilin-type N-terminal cleavage/methylation domain-containing protein [Lachnospiraceae bacterium]
MILETGFIKKNNKGISLVELVIVIAIMSVIIGTASLGFGMVSTKAATQCASNMEISLNRCRIHTMGKSNGLVAFYADSNGEIWMVEKHDYTSITPNITDSDCEAKDYTIKKIGKKGLTVSCAGTDILSTPDTPVIFEFKRSDGSLKNIYVGSVKQEPSVENYIKVRKGSREYTVTVQKLTGKVSLKQS